jgi:hypothetical protein
MIKFLTNIGFADTLEWFQCKRWMYHGIKFLASGCLAFALRNFNVPMIWTAVTTVGILVWVPHGSYVSSVGLWTELKDTIFDSVIVASPLLIMIPKEFHYTWQAWVTMVAGAMTLTGAYLLMLKQKWNRP